MARIDLDRLYALFNSEASEQDGNFYFVKQYDEKLYSRLCKIERNAVVNLEHSGSELRNALEYFLRTAYLDSDEGKAAYEEKKKMPANPFDFLLFFEKHPDLGVDVDTADVVRRTTNVYHHVDLKNKEFTPPKTYRSLCNALRCMQAVLIKYYKKRYPDRIDELTVSPYDPDKQPYDDKMVCAVIDAQESTACEKQVLCSRRNERLPDMTQYYLLRVYRAYDISEGAIRDEKVLGNLWANTLHSIPNIVRYSTLRVEYGGEDPIREKKYIISYDFGTFKPLPLHKKVVEKLSGRQRLMIMRDIAAGVGVLHRAGIYHRNLQPGSVFVFFDRKSDYVQAKLVGFEYAKIDGDLNTVINYLKQGRSGDSSPYFSQTMKDGLADSYLGSRISWQKEDIYSMGAIFYLILTGKEPPLTFDENAFSDISDPDLRNLLASMLSADAGLRPDADETEQELQKYM